MITITNEDNMQLMARYPDKHFDLAIVDPPFGIGEDWNKSQKGSHYGHKSTYKNDSIPSSEYFDELFRVSKNQIIWGANYYSNLLPPSNNIIVWDKRRNCEKTFMSEGELAWTSFNKFPFRIITAQWDGFKKGPETRKKTIHPHQKPVILYKWLLQNYACKGDKILDTHLGSGSIAIACNDYGFDLVACELDPVYYSLAMERFNKHVKQLTLTI